MTRPWTSQACGRTSSTSPGGVDGPRPHPRGAWTDTVHAPRQGRVHPRGCGRSPSATSGRVEGVCPRPPKAVDGVRPRFVGAVHAPTPWTGTRFVHALGVWVRPRPLGGVDGVRLQAQGAFLPALAPGQCADFVYKIYRIIRAFLHSLST